MDVDCRLAFVRALADTSTDGFVRSLVVGGGAMEDDIMLGRLLFDDDGVVGGANNSFGAGELDLLDVGGPA